MRKFLIVVGMACSMPVWATGLWCSAPYNCPATASPTVQGSANIVKQIFLSGFPGWTCDVLINVPKPGSVNQNYAWENHLECKDPNGGNHIYSRNPMWCDVAGTCANPPMNTVGSTSNYLFYANGETGDIPINDSSVFLSSSANQTITIRTYPVVNYENGQYTYSEFMQGNAVDDLGTVFQLTWTYEQSCGRGCRPNGAMNVRMGLAAGRIYQFFLKGFAIVPNGTDTSQFGFHTSQ